jgi:hypothetical protein
MTKNFDVSKAIERLRADYVIATGESPFKHFFCPILHVDEDVELCAGHVINESIPGSSRKCVVQRKDVDGFFGSIVESDFTTVLEVNGKTIDDLVESDELRGKVRLSVNVDGRSISHNEPRRRDISQEHSLVNIGKRDGGFLTLALKVSAEELNDATHLRLTVDKDYTAHAVASLLKAAHLTMFSIMGYKYVFGPSGQDTARILRDFYLINRKQTGTKRAAAVLDYFEQFSGMVMPLGGFANDTVRGSIEDNRFIVCVGSSGQFFALGVLVRTGDKMSIVLLAPDDAEAMGTYMNFTKNRWKNSFHYHLADYVHASTDEGAYWKGYQNRLQFDPAFSPAPE